MSKAPSFQFYPSDWLSAPEVRRISPMARGIWMDLLCYMWKEREQGKLVCTIQELSRMTGATLDEAAQFLREAKKHELCDLKILGDVTNGHTEVTLVNRRMHGEWKDRESARLRKQKQRKSQGCPSYGHDEITPYSSSSSSTSKTEEESSLRSDSCAEVVEPPAAPEPVVLPKLVGTLPLADGSDFEVRQDLVDELRPLFPAVDALQALRSMKAWLLADPKRRKTSRGIRRFITGWLDREQNRGGNMQPARASPPRDPTTPRNYRECQDLERRQEAARLKAAMGGSDAGLRDSASGIGPIQPRPLPAKSLDA